MEAHNLATRGRRSSGVGSQSLEQEVSNLLALDIVGLGKKWSALFGAGPPSRVGRTLLIGAIGYRLQEKAVGGLTPSAARVLTESAINPGTAVQVGSRRPK
jgi:hypothetical protein